MPNKLYCIFGRCFAFNAVCIGTFYAINRILGGFFSSFDNSWSIYGRFRLNDDDDGCSSLWLEHESSSEWFLYESEYDAWPVHGCESYWKRNNIKSIFMPWTMDGGHGAKGRIQWSYLDELLEAPSKNVAKIIDATIQENICKLKWQFIDRLAGDLSWICTVKPVNANGYWHAHSKASIIHSIGLFNMLFNSIGYDQRSFCWMLCKCNRN